MLRLVVINSFYGIHPNFPFQLPGSAPLSVLECRLSREEWAAFTHPGQPVVLGHRKLV